MANSCNSLKPNNLCSCEQIKRREKLEAYLISYIKQINVLTLCMYRCTSSSAEGLSLAYSSECEYMEGIGVISVRSKCNTKVSNYTNYINNTCLYVTGKTNMHLLYHHKDLAMTSRTMPCSQMYSQCVLLEW